MADSISVEKWLDFWKYYEGTPNQELGVRQLFEGVPSSLKLEDSSWITKYREPEPKPEVSNPIEVVYDCQLNHGDEGWRLCFTASCAMTMHFHRPDIPISEYYAKRPSFGDSTDPSAQIRTLQYFGLKTKYVQIGSIEKLKEQIALNRPTPVGILHHGVSPGGCSGGGHWMVALGTFEEDGGGVICHDPYGRLDERGGGYPETGGTYGKYVKYHWKYWGPRWTVANDHDGWGLGVML